jgi:hypothetical protein
MDRSSVSQISCEHDLEAFQSTMGLPDCEQIKHCLSRVMPSSVTAVEDGHVSGILCVLSSALAGVSHSDDVGVAINHLNGVKERLSFHHRGGLDIAQIDDIATEPLHCCLEGHSCAGAWLEEQIPQNFTLQKGEIRRSLGHWEQPFSVI